MQRLPSGDRPRRDPEKIRQAATLLATIDTDDFEAIFASLCQTVPEVGEHHSDPPFGPLVIIGIEMNESAEEITALSEPQTIEGNPLDTHPYKPAGMADYDVVGMVHANEALDSPELIQGALVEQLLTQWHLLKMFAKFTQQLGGLFTDTTTFDNAEFNNVLDDVVDSFFDSVENQPTPSTPSRSFNPSTAFGQYSPDELEHLDITADGMQCRHCGAIYTHEKVREAVRCCPADDGGTPIDEQDHSDNS